MLVLCSKCSTVFDCQEPKCPNCGSMDRDIGVFDSFDMYEKHIGVQDLSGETYSGKSKFFYEVKTKPDFDRDTQQNVMVERTFDRREDKDSYIEEIKTKSVRAWAQFACVILDHTYGLMPETGYPTDHMNARDVAEAAARLRAQGLLTPRGHVFATHLSHENMLPHEEMSAFARAHGYEIAFDGLTLTL